MNDDRLIFSATSPPTDSWFARIMATCLIYGLTAAVVGIWLPTDSPHQPGDTARSLGKTYISIAVTWLFFRWYSRHRAHCSSTPAASGNPNPAADPAAEGKN